MHIFTRSESDQLIRSIQSTSNTQTLISLENFFVAVISNMLHVLTIQSISASFLCFYYYIDESLFIRKKQTISLKVPIGVDPLQAEDQTSP